MKILHYLSGLPPVRGGGMIKYALDLAEAQSYIDDVFLLIPGTISPLRSRRANVRINRAHNWKQIPVFRIRNPLPIPMANGILDMDDYSRPCKTVPWREFLTWLQPEIIHVHTLMGLHAEFLRTARELDIPVLYTTHDYFGICPKASLMDGNVVCSQPGRHCQDCCRHAFSRTRLVLEQSSLYALYRRTPFLIRLLHSQFFQPLLKGLRSRQPETKDICAHECTAAKTRDYAALLQYYRDMFRLIDFYHFNSRQTKRIYEKFLGSLPGEIVTISNLDISDRRCKRVPGNILRLGFLGGDAAYKGLESLQQSVRHLYETGMTQIELHVYGSAKKSCPDICRYHPAYKSFELGQVFSQMDVLVVPSQCPETFGMVVLEAISYGIPVIVTELVGAKDIVLGGDKPLGWVVEASESALEDILRFCYSSPASLIQINDNILQAGISFHYEDHVRDMKILYARCLKG